MIFLCIFSATLISPQNILGIHNPNEIWFLKGRQTAKILASGNVMENVFGICHWGEPGSSTAFGRNRTDSLNIPKNQSDICINASECNQSPQSYGKPELHLFQCSSEGLGGIKKRKIGWSKNVSSSWSVCFRSRRKRGLYAIHLGGHNHPF